MHSHKHAHKHKRGRQQAAGHAVCNPYPRTYLGTYLRTYLLFGGYVQACLHVGMFLCLRASAFYARVYALPSTGAHVRVFAYPVGRICANTALQLRVQMHARVR
jgi:hypothetical protein